MTMHGSFRPELEAARSRAALPTLALALALAALVGCDLVTTDDPPDLSVSISASPSAVTLGAEITFEADATGNHLTFMIIRFGDGNTDVTDPLGAQVLSRTVSHTYEEEGVFVVEVEVSDITGGTTSDSVEVEVLPLQN